MDSHGRRMSPLVSHSVSVLKDFTTYIYFPNAKKKENILTGLHLKRK